jgi:hypothetical protein
MVHTSSDKLRFDLVTELLKGLEGEKPIDETLTSAEKLFIKDLSDKITIESKQRITTLKQSYSQQKIKEDEAKTEISNILLMLT